MPVRLVGYPTVAASKFDRKFGEDFLPSVPTGPGVYRVFDADGVLVYVGKATSLRQRLAQYRRATRQKAHRKMRLVVASAARIEFECCDSELAAVITETRLIQAHRPRLNVVGAYSFLYPFVGLRVSGAESQFCYTSRTELVPDFDLHGAFRSRATTWGAFAALMSLLEYLGHRGRGRRSHKKGLIVFRFRRVPMEIVSRCAAFLRGESPHLLQALALALVDRPRARKESAEVQSALDALVGFYREEATPLAAARRAVAGTSYPVLQTERDVLFATARRLRASSPSLSEHAPSPPEG